MRAVGLLILVLNFTAYAMDVRKKYVPNALSAPSRNRVAAVMYSAVRNAMNPLHIAILHQDAGACEILINEGGMNPHTIIIDDTLLHQQHTALSFARSCYEYQKSVYDERKACYSNEKRVKQQRFVARCKHVYMAVKKSSDAWDTARRGL